MGQEIYWLRAAPRLVPGEAEVFAFYVRSGPHPASYNTACPKKVVYPKLLYTSAFSIHIFGTFRISTRDYVSVK